MSYEFFQEIYRERPNFHKSGSKPTCWRIGRETADFIYKNVNGDWNTLETGAGLSTLIFALKNCSHLAVTPRREEIETIEEYARSKSISLEKITFINEPSEKYLPKSSFDNLRLVLIDGQHAFPWPIIDWFYVAEKLVKGGIVVIDDITIPSVDILRIFLAENENWKKLEGCSANAVAFQKLNDASLNVGFNKQCYNIKRMKKKRKLIRLISKIRRSLK